jgi:hypothetical protein
VGRQFILEQHRTVLSIRPSGVIPIGKHLMACSRRLSNLAPVMTPNSPRHKPEKQIMSFLFVPVLGAIIWIGGGPAVLVLVLVIIVLLLRR